MAQNRVGIVGAGAAGCAVACFAKGQNLTLFDNGEPLRTLLYTGGGRCNLAHAQYDFKELAKNYPRGEKFLYSVFSRFATPQTLDFFKGIGIETYTQEDDRIFPKSNSAKDVREKILNHAYKNKAKFIKENVYKIKKINDVFIINEKYEFDKIVISTGGHSEYAIIKSLGHSIVEPKPALVGLITEQKHGLEGVSLKNIEIKVGKRTFNGDMLFTKNGVSGPIIYTISSIFARTDYSKNNPLKLSINFGVKDLELDKNGKKDLKTVLSTHMPKSVAEYICNEINAKNQRCCEITKELRTKLEKHLTEFPLTVIGHEKHGEVVTSGGVSLNEINPKTMESKLIKNLYFCGEVVDIDGFCGGYNLQNAWSTAYIVSEALCYNEA